MLQALVHDLGHGSDGCSAALRLGWTGNLTSLEQRNDVVLAPVLDAGLVGVQERWSIPVEYDAARRIASRFRCSERIARFVACVAVTQPLHEIGTAVPICIAGRVRLV